MSITNNNQTPCYAVIAYRWGWLNESHYIVRVTTDLQAAKDAADAEAMHRGGKYGVTVYDGEGNTVYHSPSSYLEKSAVWNHRIDLFQSIGGHVVTWFETEQPVKVDYLNQLFESKKNIQKIIEDATLANSESGPKIETN